MRDSIWLKFGTNIGGLKVNISIKCRVNLINIQGVISNFTYKTKSNFSHAYRVNCFKEQAENQCVAQRSVFWWLESIEKEITEI